MKQITVVHCWSAPRSRSTALLYSFEARGDDCVTLDEPHYRAWLNKCPPGSLSRPYLSSLISGTPPKGSPPENAFKWEREKLSFEERVREAANGLPDGGLIFCKDISKFAEVYDWNNEIKLDDIELIHKHVLLVRDAVAVLSSWGAAGNVHGDNPTTVEVGIIPLLNIYSTLQSRGHTDVFVLDAEELVADPPAALKALCKGVGAEYKESMYVRKNTELSSLCDLSI